MVPEIQVLNDIPNSTRMVHGMTQDGNWETALIKQRAHWPDISRDSPTGLVTRPLCTGLNGFLSSSTQDGQILCRNSVNRERSAETIQWAQVNTSEHKWTQMNTMCPICLREFLHCRNLLGRTILRSHLMELSTFPLDADDWTPISGTLQSVLKCRSRAVASSLDCPLNADHVLEDHTLSYTLWVAHFEQSTERFVYTAIRAFTSITTRL